MSPRFPLIDRTVAPVLFPAIAVVASLALSPNRLTVAGDSDGDGVKDVADCSPADPASWRVPAPVDDLGLSGGAVALLSWSAPSDPGGRPPRYDVLRSVSPSDFSSPTFVLMDGPGRIASDAAVPAVAFFYKVRAKNGCGGLP